MPFKDATQAEIVRAAQKDEFVILKLVQQVHEITQKIAGVQKWMAWSDFIHSLVELAYFTHTTLSGGQTLGEEYVNIVQVDPSRVKVPSFTRRLLMVMLHVVGPRVFELLLAQLEARLPKMKSWQQLQPEVQLVIQTWLGRLRQIVVLLHRLHMTIFYLRGSFYHAAKRFASVRYVLIRNWLGDSQRRAVFNILSILSAVQLTVALARIKSSSGKNSEGTESSAVSFTSGKEICSLCWGQRKQTTATPCGHLFCWTCITEWMTNKNECPLCRDKFTISRIIPLQNYDAPANES